MASRSIQVIIGILAVLKTGSAYLPIDPDYPPARIRYMLSDATPCLLLSQSQQIDTSLFSGQWMDLDDPSLYGGSGNRQKNIGSPRSLAYVIYTSGTTGKPKGVMIEHRSLMNLCHWHNRYFNVTAQDHSTQYANSAFDASIWEIFPYLIAGASLFIIDNNIKLDIEGLNRYFIKHQITICFLPTPICEQFLLIEQNNLSLRVLMTGGDKLRLSRKKPTSYIIITVPQKIPWLHHPTW